MKKSIISMALAVVVMQIDGLSSAAIITMIHPISGGPPWPPGLEVKLQTDDPLFEPDRNIWAGVVFGTVTGVGDAAFFCSELNHDVDYISSFYADVDILAEAPLHDGSSITTPQLLSESLRKMCLLEAVYLYLGVTEPNGYTVPGKESQDLTGTTTQVGNLSYTDPDSPTPEEDAKFAAAQLVMWEIIHEPDSIFLNPSAPIISLTEGKLKWTDTDGNAFGTAAGSVGYYFNEITSAAYAHCGPFTAVPEVTSPVALIAGGLLFLRRREPRALRLKSLVP